MATNREIASQIVAGETLTATVTIDGQMPAVGVSLVYRFGTRPNTTTVTAVDDLAGGWTLSLSSAQTLTFEAGPVRFDALLTVGTGVSSVDSGTLVVVANPAAISKWQTVLESVEAAIASWGMSDQRTMSIEGMMISFRDLDELLNLRAFCVRQIARESGTRRPQIIRARFA